MVNALLELLSYGDFRRGWDGYDGLPFSPAVLSSAADAVRSCLQACRAGGVTPEEITPGPASDGTVDVEVVSAPRHLILTFDADVSEAMHVYYEDEELGVAGEIDVAAGKASLERWWDWLLRKGELPARSSRGL